MARRDLQHFLPSISVIYIMFFRLGDVYILPELRADVFRRHASALEVYGFVAVDER